MFVLIDGIITKSKYKCFFLEFIKSTIILWQSVDFEICMWLFFIYVLSKNILKISKG
jgi:hypothetical protein